VRIDGSTHYRNLVVTRTTISLQQIKRTNIILN